MSEQAHHEESFITKYFFSTDHKVIGIQYGLTAMFFLVFGFCLMLLMRWQLAYPGTEIPLFGKFLVDGGVMTPELYNQFGAMHGTIMVFLGVVPMAVGAFGNYFLPLQIGGDDTEWGVALLLQSTCGAVAGCEVTTYFDNVKIEATAQ